MENKTLRVGVLNVIEREAMLLRGLIRLNADSEHCQDWQLVDCAPYDLLFVDPVHTDAPSLAALSVSTPIVSLINKQQQDQANSLQRPISSDALIHCLARARQHATRAPAVIALDVPKQSMSGITATQPVTLDWSAKFKLLRWPPMAVLRGEPARLRMATMLSRQAMKVKELAQFAQQPLEQVQQFINALHQAGLLFIGHHNDAHAPKLGQALQFGVKHSVASLTLRGLMSHIRQKLGIFHLATG
jgi:hypothetical protein